MAGGSGGKGDKTSSTIRLPPELEAFAMRNLTEAEKASKIGYVPYTGPTVGALNEVQIGAMEQNEAAMRAFGMTPTSVRASIPQATTYSNGIQGYSPMGLYMDALGQIDPAQRAAIDSFTNPQGAAAARAPTAGTKGGGSTQGLSPQMQQQSDRDWAKMKRDPLYRVAAGGKGGTA